MFGFKSRRALATENAMLRQIIAEHEANHRELTAASIAAQAGFDEYRRQAVAVINDLAGKLESNYRIDANGAMVQTEAPAKPGTSVKGAYHCDGGNVINVEFKR